MLEERSYQQDAVEAAREALSVANRALIVMASGLGKMLTSALVWNGFRQGRGLFLVHSNDILDHAIKEYGKVFCETMSRGLFNGRNKQIDGIDIVFATFQSMRENLGKFPADYFAWMTVDETHHAQAETYREVIEHFLCPRLGITATPDRDDLKDIRELFGQEVFELGFVEAIARGLLPKIEYHLMADQGLDQNELEKIAHEVIAGGRKVHLGQLNKRLFVARRDEEVAQIIKSYGHKALIFCGSIDHTIHFRSFFKSGATYHSGNFRKRNQVALEAFREGRVSARYLLVVDSFNEGVDFPEVELIVFYRSTESERIFMQQLGRGLRPGKERLIVLDFVGNLERIMMLRKLQEEITEHESKFGSRSEGNRNAKPQEKFHLEGSHIRFHFTDSIVSLIEIIQALQVDFYPTWQEAAWAAQGLGCKTMADYPGLYKQDPRLPANPREKYLNYPGDSIFFGRPGKFLYPTWREASRVAVGAGIKSSVEYRNSDKQVIDPGLPAHPDRHYADFPGWQMFLETGKYEQLQAAQKAAKALGIASAREYVNRYKEDSRLPTRLKLMRLKGWQGWNNFLDQRVWYPNLRDASKAARALGIKTAEYGSRYKEDPRLPSNPHITYRQEWQGGKWNWSKFLGTK